VGHAFEGTVQVKLDLGGWMLLRFALRPRRRELAGVSDATGRRGTVAPTFAPGFSTNARARQRQAHERRDADRSLVERAQKIRAPSRCWWSSTSGARTLDLSRMVRDADLVHDVAGDLHSRLPAPRSSGAGATPGCIASR
jgi:hypothetical protein